MTLPNNEPKPKTVEEILEDICPNRPWINGGKTDTMILKVAKFYANQEVNRAIDEALRCASENAYAYPVNDFRGNDSAEVDKQSILSLKEKIIKNLDG